MVPLVLTSHLDSSWTVELLRCVCQGEDPAIAFHAAGEEVLFPQVHGEILQKSTRGVCFLCVFSFWFVSAWSCFLGANRKVTIGCVQKAGPNPRPSLAALQKNQQEADLLKFRSSYDNPSARPGAFQ